MKYLLLAIIFISSLSGISDKKDFDLSEFEIEAVKWNSFKTCNDTLFNPDFTPNPYLVLHDTHFVNKKDSLQLDLKITKLKIDTSARTIELAGFVSGGWFGGYSSEVIIMTATRQESEFLYRDSAPGISPTQEAQLSVDTIKCIKFIKFDYAHTDYGLKNTRKFNCVLNYKDNNDILFFGLEGCYARLFDLRKIIKKYGYQQTAIEHKGCSAS